MGISLKEGEAYAALRDAVASQIQEMKALQGPSHHRRISSPFALRIGRLAWRAKKLVNENVSG